MFSRCFQHVILFSNAIIHASKPKKPSQELYNRPLTTSLSYTHHKNDLYTQILIAIAFHYGAATFAFAGSKVWEKIPSKLKSLSYNNFYEQYKQYLLNTQ